MLERIRGAWSVLRGKESATGRLVSQGRVGRPVSPSPMQRFEQFAEEGYTNNVVAYRCIKEISSAVANVPILLRAGEDELDRDHDLLKLLRRPNPAQGYVAHVEQLLSYYLIAGNAYHESVGPDRGPPRELWNLRPDRTKPIPGDNGLPQGYQYTVGMGTPEVFPVDPLTGRARVLHLKTFHPLDDWYGLSPIRAASLSINQHNLSGQWNQTLLEKDARPSGAVETKVAKGSTWVPMTDEQWETTNRRVAEQVGGPQNAGRVLMLDGLEFRPYSFSPHDMDWLEGKHTSARDVCYAFGYPPQLLGIPGDNTYSNYKEARQAVYENTVLPLTNMLLSEWNNWLAPQFADGLELVADEDQVLGLAPRRESLWDRVNASTFLTDNEKRLAVGYEPHEPTGDPADDLRHGSAPAPMDNAAALEKALVADGLEQKQAAEIARLAYGRANGEWFDAHPG